MAIFRFFAILTTILLLDAEPAWSQFHTDFTGATLQDWYGEVHRFRVNENQRLQLNDNQAGRASISHPVSWSWDTLVWQGYIRMDFAPSNSNNVAYYLYASDSMLSEAPAIYFQIGQNGSADGMELVFKTDEEENIFPIGTPGEMAHEPAVVFFQLEGYPSGHWILSTNYTGEKILNQENTIQHALPFWPDQGFIGIECQYTSTRATKFYFDDLYAGPIIPDTIPPYVTNLSLLDSAQLRIDFSEPMKMDPLLEVNSYNITQNQGISWLDLLNNSQKTILMGLEPSLQHSSTYQLQFNNLIDKAGNPLMDTLLLFTYYHQKTLSPYDVIINEIMADPYPTAGLPNREYIELFNRTEFAGDAKKWTIHIGSDSASLPDKKIKPNEYLIICEIEDVALFRPYGSVWGVDLPALKNSGERITLKDSLSQIIDYVDYSDSWYQSTDKKNGGWSLEKTDPDNPCCIQSGWLASRNPQGGTPGKANSYLDSMTTPPEARLVNVYPLDSNQIKLTFSCKVNAPPSNADDNELMEFNPPVEIEDVEYQIDSANIWILGLKTSLEQNTIYQLHWLDSIQTCNGTHFKPELWETALPVTPSEGDIIINEILFDPVKEGTDYIELFNTSTKAFDLSDFHLRRYCEQNFDGANITIRDIFLPGTYRCISENKDRVMNLYPQHDQQVMREVELPALPNDSGCLQLIYGQNQQFIMVDSIYYEQNFHHPLLLETEGVALERINQKANAISEYDWVSAAASSQYGTPGLQNSQYSVATNRSDWWKLHSTTFSPDGDGFEDQLVIEIQPESHNGLISAEIYTLEGFLIATITENLLAGDYTLLTWDGSLNDSSLTQPGPYLLKLTLLYPDGRIQLANVIIVYAKIFK